MTTPRILIVAGSDSGGGAGIQADIKTATMLGCHAMTAITAVTAQNTLGVDAVHAVPVDIVVAQIDAVVRDIGVDAIKIGMIGSARTAHAVADKLAELPGVPIVFDPVMIASSGARLADEATIAAFDRLMALAAVTTPNLPEAKALGGVAAMLGKARAVLEKGGHGEGEVVIDRLHQSGSGAPPVIEWSGPRIDGMATHGTGCTLSTGIACELAKEWTLPEAIGRARDFVRISMLGANELGRGAGPMAQQGVRLDLNQSRWSPMLNQVTVPADDVAASEHFYRLLGLKQIVRSSRRYARFETEGGATFSIEMTEERKRPLVFFEVGDLGVIVPFLKGQGLSFTQEPVDRPWGWREARLLDPAGNEVCLYQAGEMRRFPPWRIGGA
ncbi:bifunctional hydroxymethylpyrimidine kinase/phosphomethylpyrimidine kinase [Sphingomonas sp. Leaf25]|uniref:bifunctional hydroxymethylpyrimidine kinase/phosphomethylpyrimidine kinase n=1 Tax=Sphingomonas sp. Leaf25 TaxID=1735692 RepID=UPI0006FF215A|nr:bifunctional hydroxymethylpyrimidine kinase/phosphomethylpyrimidine kinase [Sphingomonas sp. Leaf25]KQM98824.1 phosphomethylpyrimidine kinase [Sphingomonas sp. Leaf25]